MGPRIKLLGDDAQDAVVLVRLDASMGPRIKLLGDLVLGATALGLKLELQWGPG